VGTLTERRHMRAQPCSPTHQSARLARYSSWGTCERVCVAGVTHGHEGALAPKVVGEVHSPSRSHLHSRTLAPMACRTPAAECVSGDVNDARVIKKSKCIQRAGSEAPWPKYAQGAVGVAPSAPPLHTCALRTRSGSFSNTSTGSFSRLYLQWKRC